MIKINKSLKEIIFVLSFIILFIAIRSLYFKNLFAFIFDQVSSSTTVLELWRSKKLSLIGPSLSFVIAGKQIFFGGISYYIQLIFLLIGRFDPFWSTYAFMIFAGFMILPLYHGVKKLIHQNAAIIMVVLYSFLPFSIESTIALWNPYFLFALLPLLVYLMAKFKEKNRLLVFLPIAVLNGVLFQLHYMYIFTILGLLAYYFVFKKLGIKYLFVFLVGLCLGFINMLLFELRHNFYNLQTLVIYFSKPQTVIQHWLADYYFSSVFLFVLLIILYLLRKKIRSYLCLGLFIVLFIVAFRYVTIDTDSRNFPKDWYYKDELKTYKIIKGNLPTIKDFNIFEFYVATATLPKYFLKKDNIQINFDDYYHNKYLYVVYKNESFTEDPAYEVHSFKPFKIVRI
ncbi:glycosyltransferase family 39 protein [Candidatus Roizmanbacteria bacterium]|nr:glycosyltransferase family 39 protein [Candidatus Roizmanbacteria bacterium]